MWLSRAPRTGKRCAPRCRGKGTGEQAREAQGSRNKPRKEIGDWSQGPRSQGSNPRGDPSPV